MGSVITLLFQGEVRASPPLAAADEREALHAAFPLSPPRDALSREDFRAWKMAPLSSGRLLLTTILNRGDVDDYDRPVLRAHGCLLESGEMTGALRDPTAIFEALESCEVEQGFEALARRVEALSIHSAPEAFALFRAALERAGAFHARAAAALGEETADLYVGDPGSALDLLRPALGLLPRRRLHRLHLAIGAEASDYREPLLALAGGAPDSWREGGLLSGLFGRKKDERSAVAVDFESREVFGKRADGPAALAAAVADGRPWPGIPDARDRYRVLLECLDAAADGNPLTPFEVVAELEEMRRTVRRIEKLSSDLARWR